MLWARLSQIVVSQEIVSCELIHDVIHDTSYFKYKGWLIRLGLQVI